MNWKKVYVYGIGYFILIAILFTVTGIYPSLFGLGILFLTCIKTLKDMILTILFMGCSHWLMYKIAGGKND